MHEALKNPMVHTFWKSSFSKVNHRYAGEAIAVNKLHCSCYNNTHSWRCELCEAPATCKSKWSFPLKPHCNWKFIIPFVLYLKATRIPMPLRSFEVPHSAVAMVASDQLDAASFGSRSFGLARLERDIDAVIKCTSNMHSSHRKEAVRIHGWLHTSGFSSSPAQAKNSSKISLVVCLGRFHHYDPQKEIRIFDFYPYFLLQLL